MELNSPKQGLTEVVVVIPGEEPPSAASKNVDPKMATLEDSAPTPKLPQSPEIVEENLGRRKPPRPPTPGTGFSRRRSIPASAFSKPKSRFVEQSIPLNFNSIDDARPVVHGSPNHSASSTPKTISTVEDDEEEEIYKKPRLTGKEKWRINISILIEFTILVAALSYLVATFTVHKLEDSRLLELKIWKWCFMLIVICCKRLITLWLMKVVVFMVARNFSLKKKAFYFVHRLRSYIQMSIWLGLIVFIWFLLFSPGIPKSPEAEKVIGFVSRALISLLVGSMSLLMKTLFVKIMASQFHVNKFFDRIQESIFCQYVLQILSGPPVKVGAVKSTGQMSFRSRRKGKGVGEEEGVIDVAKLHKIPKEKVSTWTMKGLINVIRSSRLTTISNTMDKTFNEVEEKDKEITSEWEAKDAAYRIFKNVAKPDYKYIDREDLMRFLNKEEIDQVFPLFEGATETGKIKKSALKNWVVKAYFDRKSLDHSLNDTKTAVKQLHKIVTTIVMVVIIIVTLLVMGFATTNVLLVLSSQVTLGAFLFGNTCKVTLEAIIFVFVIHPFDVGDRCVVDGVQMIVEEISILTTVFLKLDNEKIYYPNAVLATKPISNFYRSPDMKDTVEFSIDVATSIEKINALKARIKMYIDSKPNHWHPNHSIVVKDIVNANKMSMALHVQHTMNFQDIVEKNIRRTDLLFELKKMFQDLFIPYDLLPQEIQPSCKGVMPPLIPAGQTI